MANTAKSTASKALRGCGCGCGANVAGKSTFRPGHDARLASLISKDLVHGNLDYTNAILDTRFSAGTDLQELIDEMRDAMLRKFGGLLAQKTWNASMNVWARTKNERTQAAKKDIDSTPEGAPKLRIVSVDGDNVEQVAPVYNDELIPQITPAEPVRIGRWTYPARTNEGTLERNTKRDGTGEWVPVEK